MPILDISVQLGCATTAVINANPNHLLLEGQILFYTDGVNKDKYYRGDGVTLLSSLPLLGGSGGGGLTVGTTTITSGTNTRILYNNAGVLGEYLVTGTGTTAVLSTSPTFTNTITVTGNNAGALSSLFTNTNSAGWSNLSVFNDTSKSISLVSFGSTTAIGTFYDANTAWVVADTTNTGIVNENASGTIRFITGGFGAVNERVRIGTATTHLLLNQVLINTTTAPGGSLSQVRILKGTGTIDIGEQASGRGAIWVNQATPSNTNFALSADTSNNVFLNGGSGLRFLVAGSIYASFSSTAMDFGSGQTAYNLTFTSTNGTKLGTATSQKIGIWNATPIVQPTTAVAAATFVTNTSLIANDTATFDGYTIGQVVKALRNIGLLA